MLSPLPLICFRLALPSPFLCFCLDIRFKAAMLFCRTGSATLVLLLNNDKLIIYIYTWLTTPDKRRYIRIIVLLCLWFLLACIYVFTQLSKMCMCDQTHTHTSDDSELILRHWIIPQEGRATGIVTPEEFLLYHCTYPFPVCSFPLFSLRWASPVPAYPVSTETKLIYQHIIINQRDHTRYKIRKGLRILCLYVCVCARTRALKERCVLVQMFL